MHKTFAASFVAGLLSAGLFLLSAGLGLGVFFLFISTLPILLAGLSPYRDAAIGAAFAAAIGVGAAGGFPLGVVFLFTFSLPAWYLSAEATRRRVAEDGSNEWFALGITLSKLCAYACLGIAILTAFVTVSGDSISQELASAVHTALPSGEGSYNDLIEAFATDWSFLIFPMAIWLWGIALYGHGWLANRMLHAKGKAIRPNFIIAPFPMPNWMLSLLLIAALASLIGGTTLSFLGKATFISLMLPYFFSGAASMNRASTTWPSRRVLLFFVYLTIFIQFWPALILSAIGLGNHIKRLSGAKTSSRN